MNLETSIDVSIIIVSYNQQELLTNCVKSIIKYTKDIIYEIIIVDNNSSKVSKEFILNKFNKIIWIGLLENQGFAVANNVGAKSAKGKELFFLNSDTLLTENTIKILYTYKVIKDEIGILGPKLLNKDGSVQIQGSILGSRVYYSNNPKEVNFLSGAAIMISANLYSKINGFDENYFFYNEDVDLCKTIKKLNYKLVYFPFTSIVHFGGGSSKNKNMQIEEAKYLGSLYFCKKFYSKKIYIVYKFLIMLVILIKIIYNNLLANFKIADEYCNLLKKI